MNANFLGKPSREDLHTIEQLRRQLVPMISYIDNLQLDVANKTHRGETVEWPQIRTAVSAINGYLASINNYMNGHYKHTSEELRDSEGKVMLDEEKNPRVKYRDDEVTGERDRLDALHVFPMAPFPMGNERLAAMGLTLLDKRLGPAEEKWVEERLRKAAEFAYVPGDLGVDLKKPEIKKEADEDDEDDLEGWDAGLPTKRVKGSLNEDDLMEMWAVGHKTAFDRRYQREKGLGDGGEEGEDDEDEDEEMEDVEVDGLKPSQAQGGSSGDAAMDEDDEDEEEESDDARGRPAPPVQLIQQAQPSVHKPVPGIPIMSLGLVHRFMATGEVQAPAGQR